MISEKLRMIKQKSMENAPVNGISDAEIAQITARLLQIKPQIPQIDKLLQLYSKLPANTTNSLANSPEMVKKLSDCRNVLFSQLEVVNSKSNNFIMNLNQLNLLIEQVQRLFNSLVAKMKESAGVSPTTTIPTTTSPSKASSTTTTNTSINKHTPIHSQTTAFSTASTTLTAAPSLASSSSSSHSASLSIHKKLKSSASSSSISKSSASFSYEKLLLQRLSLPDTTTTETNNNNNNWLSNFIQNQTAYHHGKRVTSTRHLKFRNKYVEKELKSLPGKQRVKIQENEFGFLSLLLQNTRNDRFIFQLSPKYPFDTLIYRIESSETTTDFQKFTTLPPKYQPETLPMTVSNILRNYEHYKTEQQQQQ